MTAKLKTGYYGGEPTHGADADAAGAQLLKDHRRPGRPEGASIHSFDEQAPDDRTVDDAGIADIHQGYPAGPETPPKGEGPNLPDTEVEELEPGEGPGTAKGERDDS